MIELEWRSAGEDENRVEVAFGKSGIVLMRSSTEPDTIMFIPAGEWNAFVKGIRNGEFDHVDEQS